MGCTQNLVIPTIASSKPKSNNNSVWEGTKEIIRFGVFSKVCWVPIWSVNICFTNYFLSKKFATDLQLEIKRYPKSIFKNLTPNQK